MNNVIYYMKNIKKSYLSKKYFKINIQKTTMSIACHSDRELFVIINTCGITNSYRFWKTEKNWVFHIMNGGGRWSNDINDPDIINILSKYEIKIAGNPYIERNE